MYRDFFKLEAKNTSIRVDKASEGQRFYVLPLTWQKINTGNSRILNEPLSSHDTCNVFNAHVTHLLCLSSGCLVVWVTARRTQHRKYCLLTAADSTSASICDNVFARFFPVKKQTGCHGHLLSSSSSSLTRASTLFLDCRTASSSSLSTACSPDSSSTLAMRSSLTMLRAFLSGRESRKS